MGAARSIRKLDGRGTWGARSTSESCPLERSGTMKDLGLVGSEESILLNCLVEGSKSLTKGLVNKPNTCIIQPRSASEGREEKLLAIEVLIVKI